MDTAFDIRNRKASFEYHLLEKYTAGLVLTGPEIKSLRAGKASLAEAYALVINNEVWIRNMHIAMYVNASYQNKPEKRDRKLLLQRREIEKIRKQLQDKGNTLIPVRCFLNEKGIAKIEICLARGKKLYDKREAIKAKDVQMERERHLSGR